MEMKINGIAQDHPVDGNGYMMQAYLPDDNVYVAVTNWYNEWGYSVTDKSCDSQEKTVFECRLDGPEGSKYEAVYKMLRGMIELMMGLE